MIPNVFIRPEVAGDISVIGSIIRTAFDGMPYAAGDEAELVDALRSDGALSVSLVAELDGTVIGQIALSPARAADGSSGWFALGPVAVLPEHQRSGVGGLLVNAGLRAIERMGACGCILTGNPSYYVRFGFELSPSNVPPGEPAEFFMIKMLGGDRRPAGPVHFHPAFSHPAFSSSE